MLKNSLAMSRRNQGIDILRALSMFFVICQHILGQGGVAAAAGVGTGKYYFLSLLQILATCAVDVYGITTGYLMCEKSFRLSRLTKLWLTTVFWSVAVSCGFFVFVPESRTFRELISMFLPILRGRYWFFTAYFVVMLISPVLNLVIHSLSRRQFRLLFAALLLIFGVVPVCSLGYDVMRISGGNHFAWMTVLYLVGGYLRVHGAEAGGAPKERLWLIGYFLFVIVHLAYKIGVRLIGFSQYGDLMLTCVSPLILGEAVCLFLYFEKKGSRMGENARLENVIRLVTPGVYAVYVIHVHPKVFWSQDIIDLFRAWDRWNGLQIFLAMTVTALAVFAACILLDALRQRLFRLLGVDQAAEKASDWAEQKIRAFLKDGD